jgi:hypothetical protein
VTLQIASCYLGRDAEVILGPAGLCD